MGHTTEEGMITIKVAHCGQTKRTMFKKADLTFQSLTDWMVSAFGIQAPLNASPSRLAYRDPEGDIISIDSNDELTEALRLTPENAILSLHLSFPRPRGERWFARMCAEHAMADEAASLESSPVQQGGDASSASAEPSAPSQENGAPAAAPSNAEFGWCERRRAWKQAWKARMAEARATGAFPPAGPGNAFDGGAPHVPHHGPHGHRHGAMGPGPHHGHGRGGFGFHHGMMGRPEFCGRPEFPQHHQHQHPGAASSSSSSSSDFGFPPHPHAAGPRGPEFGPFSRFSHHHADAETTGENRSHAHPFHHHAPHPHPWTGFNGAMPPCFWMMPPCGVPSMMGAMPPHQHPWAGFAVPSAFNAAPVAPTAATAPEIPAAPQQECNFPGGFRRHGFMNREECGLKRQLNWLLVLTILVVAFHFVPIGAVAVPILGAAAATMAFCLRRKLRKLKHARGQQWSHKAMMNANASEAAASQPSASPSYSPSAPAPVVVAAPSSAAGPEVSSLEAPVRRCHGGRFHHGRDFAAFAQPAFAAPAPAAASPVPAVVPGPFDAPVNAMPAAEAPMRRCRFQPAAVSIVPPAQAPASPEPSPAEFNQFRNDLQTLSSMGFTDVHKNRKLLRRLGDVNRVVAHLTDAAAQ